MKSLTMNIRKSIHKLEDNKTFKDFRINAIPVNDLGENFMKDVVELFNGSF